jgi:hypothetical protein
MTMFKPLTEPSPGSPAIAAELHAFLPYDPVPWLLSSANPALTAFVRRDLLGQTLDTRTLWDLPEPTRLLRRQQSDGSWRYAAARPGPQNYDLYETLEMLGRLVTQFGLDQRHPAIRRAGDYVFSCQSPEGDYRGIYGHQPAPTYTAALMEVLILAGYQGHPSIGHAFRWLLASRQADGGWAIAARTRDRMLVRDWESVMSAPSIRADTSRPFSHLVTGMVLRAFAAHPRHRLSAPARCAAALLKSRFFQPDKYPDRKAAAYWTKFTFPFQFTDLLTSLDSLGKLGFPASDSDVASVLVWFREHQNRDGSFSLDMLRQRDRDLPFWLGLAICRALSRFSRQRHSA